MQAGTTAYKSYIFFFIVHYYSKRQFKEKSTHTRVIFDLFVYVRMCVYVRVYEKVKFLQILNIVTVCLCVTQKRDTVFYRLV